jgi:DNA-directed RNA polymerase subunit K/omega
MPRPTKQVAISGGAKTANDDETYDDTEEEDVDDDIEEEGEKSDAESVVEEEVAEIADKDDDAEEPSKFKADDDEGFDEGDETCLYSFKKNHEPNILDSDVFDDDLFEDEKIVQTKRIVKPEDRITKAVLTKYERVRLLSERRKQLILGAKPMIKVNSLISEKEIASLELKAKVIPIIVVRTLPNGDIEHWKIEELEIIN